MRMNVRVGMDVTSRDKFGHLLGYLFVGDTFVYMELVRQGYAQAYTYPPNVTHTEKFLAAQREAREKGLNIWHAGEPQRLPEEWQQVKANPCGLTRVQGGQGQGQAEVRKERATSLHQFKEQEVPHPELPLLRLRELLHGAALRGQSDGRHALYRLPVAKEEEREVD